MYRDTALKIQIENIGPLTSAEVDIGRFTVFAGPNDTGKSFVSKLFYSCLNSFHSITVDKSVSNALISVEVRLMRLKSDGVDPTTTDLFAGSVNDPLIDELELKVREFKQLSKDVSFSELSSIIPSLYDIVKRMEYITSDAMISPTEGKVPSGQDDFVDKNYKNYVNYTLLKDLLLKIVSLSNLLRDEKSSDNLITRSLLFEFFDNILHNFQVQNLDSIVSRGSDTASLKIEMLFDCNISSEGISNVYTNYSILNSEEKPPRVIYLESPIYWRLKNALESLPDNHNQRDRDRLSGVPKYFYDLLRILKLTYVGNSKVFNAYDMLTGETGVNGKFSISEIGDISFLRNGLDLPLSITSTGIINLGILSLLLERRFVV